jgi:hypothetical protein
MTQLPNLVFKSSNNPMKMLVFGVVLEFLEKRVERKKFLKACLPIGKAKTEK